MKLVVSGMFHKMLRGRFDSRVQCAWRDLMLWTRGLTADRCEWQKWVN